jgi:hypothetical protein
MGHDGRPFLGQPGLGSGHPSAAASPGAESERPRSPGDLRPTAEGSRLPRGRVARRVARFARVVSCGLVAAAVWSVIAEAASPATQAGGLLRPRRRRPMWSASRRVATTGPWATSTRSSRARTSPARFRSRSSSSSVTPVARSARRVCHRLGGFDRRDGFDRAHGFCRLDGSDGRHGSHRRLGRDRRDWACGSDRADGADRLDGSYGRFRCDRSGGSDRSYGRHGFNRSYGRFWCDGWRGRFGRNGADRRDGRSWRDWGYG